MTLIRHTLGTAALLAAFTGSVLAQATTPPQPGARPEVGHAHGTKHAERGAQRQEQRMTELKAALQLAPQQEAAWAQFADAMRPAHPATNAQHPDREAMMKLPTPERMDQMRAMRQQHMARMDQRAEATKTFYATLTPEQKKRFDESTARMMARHGTSRHGPQGHHG